MSEIKLICTDIDGTLLNSNKKINKADKLMLQRAWREKNIPIALVSGRFKSGLTFLADELEIPCIYSCFNGAYVEWENNIIADTKISLDSLRKVIPAIEETGSIPQIFDLNDYYFSEDNYFNELQIQVVGFEGIIGDLNKQIDKWEKENYQPYKILAKHKDPKQLEKTKQAILDLNIKELKVVQSASFILEIIPATSSKANTINLLASYLNIGVDQIMALGDYENDKEMLQAAGVSIAMGNGTDEIKSIADYVTSTSDDNGLAKAVNKFVFDNKYDV
ncbi:MAG: Cof-type HAD-IIB family hydrolase [Sphaerochaetaceae bacterium]|nr:Cof-type HAD-IIB family hydrolase [Sphaerochaetaceae bacterium]